MPRKLATLAFALLIPSLWLGAGCRRSGGAAPRADATTAAAGGASAPGPAGAGATPPSMGTPAPASILPGATTAPGAPGAPALPAWPTSPASAASAASPPLVIFLGDSLTAGLGLPADQAYPALLERRLRADGLPVRVLNAGVSGDTSAGGLRRLRWLLAQRPAVVVVGLGGNDGLRGTAVPEIESNLNQLVGHAQQAGARVLLLGMQIPPNYGPDYTDAFAAIYPRIARNMNVPLVPFLLAGVGGVAELNQADGLHPTAAGQVKVAANVRPYLEDLLHRKPAAAAAAR
jgi:acyl-CoA thioesterase-1